MRLFALRVAGLGVTTSGAASRGRRGIRDRSHAHHAPLANLAERCPFFSTYDSGAAGNMQQQDWSRLG